MFLCDGLHLSKVGQRAVWSEMKLVLDTEISPIASLSVDYPIMQDMQALELMETEIASHVLENPMRDRRDADDDSFLRKVIAAAQLEMATTGEAVKWMFP
mmetsp:Transcript_32077/g.60291  ORF Transcript_32077/g.60291 Transcript_32077/m.60291 type:complete len:100 (+) Transcript_32077:150-449(+)